MNTNKGFKFDKLVIWQKAMTLGEDINSISSNLPSKELYNLYEFSFNLMNMLNAFRNKV